MADVPIPVEGKSLFDPNAGRQIKIEKAVQTATDIGGAQVVHEVVDANLRDLRNQLSLEARKKDREFGSTTKKQTPVEAKKKSLFGLGFWGL